MIESAYSLMSELEQYADTAHPPVHLWHPSQEKDIDLEIDRDGVWRFGGTPIKRPRLIRLFASVLRKDGDEYFLVTPVEKCRIRVQDVPFQVLLMDVAGEGEAQALTMTTDMAESFAVDAEHRLRVTQYGDEWIPYVHVRSGMEARLCRAVYYQLAELMVPAADGKSLGVWSDSVFTPLLSSDALP